MTDKANAIVRKPYAPPHLVIYGGIAQITQNVTNAGTTMDAPGRKT
jgi:hypothetical protein